MYYPYTLNEFHLDLQMYGMEAKVHTIFYPLTI